MSVGIGLNVLVGVNVGVTVCVRRHEKLNQILKLETLLPTQ